MSIERGDLAQDDPGRVPAKPPTDRVRLRRLAERGHYDRATIDAILDATMIGHVGWVLDGQPFVTPTSIWRQGDRLYWHGSAGSRMIRETKRGARVCITATLLDGLVLARSGTNHSMNYRSVMVLGGAVLVEDEAETLAAMEAFTERLFPGRWTQLRPATRKEIRQTSVLWTPLDEASAKVRTGPSKDDPGDESWPVWAGVIPLSTAVGAPEPDPHLPTGLAIPPYATRPGGMGGGGGGRTS